MGETRAVAGSARIIGITTLLSRVLGMGRDMLASHYFGGGIVWDAFVLANRIPNLFRRLFGEGALTAAFVPAFVSRLEGGKREEAFLLLRRLATALALALSALALAGMAATLAFPADAKSALEGEYLRIMLPFLVLICVGAILGAALNGLRHFFMPAFAPVLANVVSILALLAFAGATKEHLGRMLSWSVLAGGVVQLLAMAAVLRWKGVPLAPETGLGDPALREVAVRFTPLVFGLSLVQVNEFLNTLIARWCVPGDGAVSALYYGNQLTQLPLSLIGTAVATASFPAMASAAAGGRQGELGDLLEKGLRGTLFLSIPATVGLVVLSTPILSLLFEHGAFTSDHTARAARVLTFYSLSLWAYCANQVQVRAFYALGDTRTPVVLSGSMVIVTLVLSLALVRPMGEAGISLATSIGGVGSFALLQWKLRKRIAMPDAALLGTVAKTLLSSTVMGAAAWGTRTILPGSMGHVPRVVIPIVVALIVYFGLALSLRMPEAREALSRRSRIPS